MLSLALLVATSLTGVFYAFDSVISNTLPPALTALAVPFAGAVLVGAALFAYWRLTRETSDIRDRQGAAGPWLGWTLLAYLPAVAAAVAFALAGHSDPDSPLILESAVVALLQTVAAPWLVHASGRAIDAAGPDVGAVWTYWKADYPALVVAFIVAVAPFTLLSDLITEIAGNGPVASLASALAYLPGSILGTLLSVEAFHRVPQKAHG